MKFKSMTFLGCLLVLFQFSCEKWDVEQISFLEVVTGTAQAFPIGTTATLEGTISGLVSDDLADEHGHVWSQNSAEPTLTDKEGQTNLGRLGNGTFNSQIDGLAPGATYAYRAYALREDKVAYGEVKTFQNSTLNIAIQIDSIDLNNLNSTEALAEVYTTISGIPDGLPIKSYGILWGKQAELSFAKDNLLPEQGVVAFSANLNFTTTLPPLSSDTYYLQPYLTINNNIYLGETTSIRPSDLWKGLADNFTPKANLLAAWSIGNKGYIITFLDGEDVIWEYDPALDQWQQKIVLPSQATFSFITFSVNGKGYIGGGQDFDNNSRREFWEYDPATNQLTQLNDLPSEWGRQEAFTFVIGDKAYMGSGVELKREDVLRITYLNDFWEYDPASDTWEQKADYPGATGLVKFTDLGFSIGDRGYAGLGTSREGDIFTDHQDFWEYDPATDTWTKKADFPGEVRSGPLGFALGPKAYVGAGFRRVPREEVVEKSQIPLPDFWAYDPMADTWSQVNDFPGTAHSREAAFSIQNQGYIATDVNSFCDVGRYFWVYRP